MYNFNFKTLTQITGIRGRFTKEHIPEQEIKNEQEKKRILKETLE